MSRTIDERVVEMKFDNSDFEKNVKQSMNTLDGLKKSLNMDGTSKGLNELADAAKGVSFDKLGDAVDTVKGKFSALEIAGITALVNITNKAVDAGLSLAKSLSVDQIASGWSKYAEKTQAVQTILSATGLSIDDVTERIEKLNWYTDETSYSLTDMTNNIGKFTANGVDLDSATTAMIGISNWAALSGQHIQEASRAMYNLSQALGTGSVQVRDWMSIENANMATKEFKDLTIQVAKAQGRINEFGQVIDQETGKVNENVKVTAETFRETLRYKWFDKNVLIDTLKLYGSLTEQVNKVYEMSDKTTSEILEDIEKIHNGSITMEDLNHYSREAIPILNELAEQVGSVGWRALKAAQEATTFQQAIDSIKDAASTKWSSIFETVFGNYDEARHLWTDLANDLYTIFADPLDSLLEDLDEAFNSPFEKLLKEAGISSSKFKEIFGDVADSSGKKISELVDKTGNFEEALRDAVSTGKVGTLELQTAMAKYIEYIEQAGNKVTGTSDEVVGNVTASLDEIKKAVWDVGSGLYGNGEARIKALTEKFGEGSAKIIQEALDRTWDHMQGNFTYEEYSKYFDEVCADMVESLSGLSSAQVEQMNYTEEEIEQIKALNEQFKEGKITAEQLVEALAQPSGRWLFTDSLRNMMASFLNILGAVRDAWDKTFNANRAERIKSFIVSFHNFSTSLKALTEGAAPKITSILTTVFSAIQKVGSAIGTVISKVWNFTKSLLAPLTSHLGELVTIIGTGLATAITWVDERATNLWNNIKGSDFYLNISKWIDGIKEKLKSLEFGSLEANLTAIQNYANKAAEKVDGFFNNLFKGSEEGKEVPTFLESIGGAFLGVKNKITGWVDELSNYLIAHGKIGTFVDQIVGSLQFLKEKISDYVHIKIFGDDPLTSISDGLQRFWKWINGWGISQKITAKLENIGIGFVNWGVEIENIWLHKIKPVLKSIADYFKDENNQIDFDKIINVAKAGALLTFILSLSNFLNAAARVRRKIGSIFTAIADRIRGGASRLTVAFKDIAVAIGIITACVLALAELEGRDTELAKKAIKDVEIILWSMVGAFAVMKTLEHFLSGGAGGITATLKQFRIGLSPLAEAVLAVVGIAGSLYLVAAAVEKLKDFNFKEDWDAVAAVIALMAVMIAGLAALKKVPGEMGFGSIAFMAIVVALNMLLPVIEKFNDFPWAKMGKGIATVIIALGVIAVIFRTMSAKLPANSKSTGVLGIAVALGVLIYSLKYLLPIIEQYNDMDWGKFANGFGKIAIMLGVLVGAIILLEKSLKDVKGLSVLGIAATLGVLIGGVAILGNMETSKMKQGVTALMEILISLGVCLGLASKMSSGIGLASIITLAVICAGLIFAIKYLSDSDVSWQMAAAVGGGIGVALLALAGSLKILSSIRGGAFNPLGALEAIGLLCIAIVAIAATGALVAWLAGILSDTQFENVQTGMTRLADISDEIGQIIGGIVGGALAGIGQGILTTIENIGTSLSNFMDNAQPFFDDVKNLTGKHLAGTTILSAIILEMATSTLFANVSRLLGIFNGGFEGVGKALSRFAKSSKDFFDFLDTLDDGDIKAAESLTNVIKALSRIPTSGGIISWFTGSQESNMNAFGTGMKQLASDFVDFAGLIKADEVTNSVRNKTQIMADCISMLVSADIPTSGGLISLINGDLGLDDFGQGMTKLANWFAGGVEGGTNFASLMSSESINESLKTSTQIMCDTIAIILGTDIPKSGGFVQWITGEAGEGLDRFGQGMVSLAKYFVEDDGFAKTISDGSSYLTEKLKTATQIMCDVIGIILGTDIPSSGGLWQSLFGEKNYGTFGENLKTLGEAMAAYGQSIEGIPTDLVEKSQILVDAMNVLSGLNGEGISTIASEFTGAGLGGGVAQGYTSKLDGLGQQILRFSESVAQLNFDAMINASDQFNNLSKAIGDFMGTGFESYDFTANCVAMIENIASGLTGNASKLQETGKTLGEDVAKSFSAVDYYQAGYNSGKGIYDGVSTWRSSLLDIGTVLGSNANIGFGNQSGGAYMAGYNAGRGFYEGTILWAQSCYNAGAYLASMTNAGYNNTLMIRSPSRVAMKAAGYYALGIIKGLENSASAVFNAGADLANSTNNGFSEAISNLATAVNEDINTDPVITPVLDLSQIQNGISNLNSIFGGTSLGVSSLGMADGISARMSVSTIPTESTSGTGVDISRAITDANAVQNSLLREEVGLLKQIIESGLSIDFDSRQITTMVTKGQRQMARANG